MRIGSLLAASFAALVVAPLAAQAAVVSVDGQAGPWDPTVSLDYGIHDNLGPTVVAVSAGQTVNIQYVSGLTSAFGGAPVVDALGYVGSAFGSGLGVASGGVGSSGKLFPSAYIDPTNTGSPVWLNALIGAFVNSSGAVIGTPFAPGGGLFSAVAPLGAVGLALGVNDDIFGDNTGALMVDVSIGVPEPAAWALMITGFGLAGGALRRRRAISAA